MSMANTRSVLHGVLQNLVDKKDDCFINVEDEPASPPDFSVTHSPSPSPRKMVMKVGRKKKRKDDIKASASQLHHTYVMKLFDRSVDLAQFDEDAPLYPICRAWMRNQPLERDTYASMYGGESDDSSMEECDENAMEDDTPHDIFKLPTPVLLDINHPGVLPPSPPPDQHLNIYKDADVADAPEQLLLGHMARWKVVRNRWRVHSRDQEERFGQSLKILRTMYERQMKDTQ